jgi:hypothetical protein
MIVCRQNGDSAGGERGEGLERDVVGVVWWGPMALMAGNVNIVNIGKFVSNGLQYLEV